VRGAIGDGQGLPVGGTALHKGPLLLAQLVFAALGHREGTKLATTSWLFVIFGEHQVMAQLIAKRVLISPLIKGGGEQWNRKPV
jgi:hypothetical protein